MPTPLKQILIHNVGFTAGLIHIILYSAPSLYYTVVLVQLK